MKKAMILLGLLLLIVPATVASAAPPVNPPSPETQRRVTVDPRCGNTLIASVVFKERSGMYSILYSEETETGEWRTEEIGVLSDSPIEVSGLWLGADGFIHLAYEMTEGLSEEGIRFAPGRWILGIDDPASIHSLNLQSIVRTAVLEGGKTALALAMKDGEKFEILYVISGKNEEWVFYPGIRSDSEIHILWIWVSDLAIYIAYETEGETGLAIRHWAGGWEIVS